MQQQQQLLSRRSCCQHPLSAVRLPRALGIPRRRHGPPGSRTATQAVAEAEGIVHISETAIVLGSTVMALGAPFIFNQFHRVSSVSASDAALLVDGSTLMVDVRSKEEIKVEGAPLLDKLSSGWDRIIFAPWFKEGTNVQNPSFVDDILLSPGIKDGTSIIIMDANGTIGQRAASLLCRTLGDRHDVFLMSGGFKAWKAANLPYNVLTMREEEEYGQAMLTDGGRTWVVPEVAASYDGLSGGAGAAAMAMKAPGLSLADVLAKLPFHPKLLDVLAEGYTQADFKRDVLSGGVVGVVALSLSMALGIASESTPAVGLYTAVIAGFLTSALGGSRVGIGGPTAAFIPIVVGVAHQYGPENLVTCTAMAGAVLIGMSLLGLGSVIKFVPRPVVTGFTAGIAAYIFSTQVKDFLGLGVPGHLPADAVIPSEFLEKLIYLGSHLPGTHGPSLALAGTCLGVMLVWPKEWAKVVPSQIVAVVVGTAALALVDGGAGIHTGIETIGSHFGPEAIPTSLPMPHLPDLRMEVVQPLIYPACTIALLAAIESLLCARVADTMIDDRHDPNAELFAQGVANIASASFGGLPATGALARTAANVRSGGRSPIAGMVHAAVVALVILVASPLALHIPLPVLSAVLVVVALNMGEWENFKALASWPERDAQLFIVSFLLTVLQDVAVAVELGMAAALLLFVKDVTQSFYVRALPPDTSLATLAGISNEQLAAVTTGYSGTSGYSGNGNGYSSVQRKMQLKVPEGTAYLELTGSLLFGAGEVLEHAVEQLQVHGPVHAVVLHMGHVGVMDVSGLEVMEEQLHRLHKANVELILCGLARQPLHMLAKVGFLDAVGRTNVCRSIDEALVRAQQLVVAAEAKGRAMALAGGTTTDGELEPEEAVELPANIAMAFSAKEYDVSHSDGATSRDEDDSPPEEEAVEGAWAPQAQQPAHINGGAAHVAHPLPEPTGASGW